MAHGVSGDFSERVRHKLAAFLAAQASEVTEQGGFVDRMGKSAKPTNPALNRTGTHPSTSRNE